jgi:hypothetical protein
MSWIRVFSIVTAVVVFGINKLMRGLVWMKVSFDTFIGHRPDKNVSYPRRYWRSKVNVIIFICTKMFPVYETHLI